jgi:ATP-binding cassette, subfamily C, bacterial
MTVAQKEGPTLHSQPATVAPSSITTQASQGRRLPRNPEALKDPLISGLRQVLRTVGTVSVFSGCMNVLLLVSPLYMLQVYDRVLASRSVTTLVALTIIAAVLLLTYGLLEMIRTRVLVRAGMMFDETVTEVVFGAIHRGILRRQDPGLTQGLRDVDSLREFLTGAGVIAFCDWPWCPIFIIACFVLHPWYGWLAIFGGAVIWSMTLLNEILTKRDLTQASLANMAASRHATSTFRNTEVLQAMGMLDALRSIWAGMHLRHLGWQAQASDRAGALMASIKAFRMFLQVLILGAGGYLAIQGEISSGAIVAGSILIGRALQPMELAVGNWKSFIAARGAYKRLKVLFDLAGAAPQRMSLPCPQGTITAESVFATAPGTKDTILRNVTFALPAGEVMCIVGPSGAGKTTLARVLVGVWPVMAGNLRLDGYDVSQWDFQELGRYVGYLPQDVELFGGTVAENIGRFQETVDPQRVIAAAELAGCHEMIQHLAEGYNTQIGEGGVALSGGQRQRIALARALYGDPSLVVLDEPNSNLDSAGEEALVHAIQAVRERGATVVLITHKINLLAIADKVLVMSNGTIQGFGPRDAIIAQLLGPRIVPEVAATPTEQIANASGTNAPLRVVTP